MKCDQVKCVFNQMGGCRPCAVCNAKPNEINDNCDRCWNCRSDEGLLRWDNNNDEKEEIAEAKKEKEQIIEVVVE